MLCLGVCLTVDELPEFCGEQSSQGTGNILVTSAPSASGYVVANGSSEISASSICLALGMTSQGGQAVISVKTTVSGDGLRKSSDGAIPINFPTSFY